MAYQAISGNPIQEAYNSQRWNIPCYVGGNLRTLTFVAPDQWAAYDIAVAQLGEANVIKSISRVG